jgi:hypothetical protein
MMMLEPAQDEEEEEEDDEEDFMQNANSEFSPLPPMICRPVSNLKHLIG